MKTEYVRVLDFISSSNHTFRIPNYQLNVISQFHDISDTYRDTFWDKIANIVESNKNGNNTEYFLGTVTYYECQNSEQNEIIIADGFKYYIAMIIFIITLEKLIDRYPEYLSDSADFILPEGLKIDHNLHERVEYAMNPAKKEPLSRDNFFYFSAYLSNEAEKWFESKNNSLKDLFEFGLQKIFILAVKLEPDKYSWESPLEMFRMGFYTDTPLPLSELVKNYLFMGLDSALQEKLYKKYWLKIEKILPDYLSEFIKDWMMAISKYDDFKEFIYLPYETADYQFFIKFKGKFKNTDRDDVEKALKLLLEYSRSYSYLVFQKSTGNKEINKYLKKHRLKNFYGKRYVFLEKIKDWKDGTISYYSLWNFLAYL